MDISDIQENMEKLIGLLDRIGVKTDELSRVFTEKMNKIQASSSDAASKQRQAMEVFTESVAEARAKLGALPSQLQESANTVESLDRKCKSLQSSMQGMKINSEEFAEANKELRNTKDALKAASDNADNMAKRINRAANESIGSLSGVNKSAQGLSLSLGKILGLMGGSYALKSLYNQMVAIRSQFQSADVAIQTMLGNKEKADDLLMKVREYAKISPLEFGDITAATKMMVGFNIEAEKVPRFIQAIGDISMGNKQNFNSLTLAFSQMSATGRLMGQDLLQMINAGFNPLTEMANQTGKSVAELKDEMSKGAISAEMVQEAFIKATSEGGKFFQMSEKGSQTIQGQLSMMQDAIDAAFNEVGQKTEGIIMTSIQTTTKLIENYDKVGRVLEGLVITYGAYRTAVALATFAENGHTITMTLLRTRILLTQKAQALLNATMLANPYVLAATAIGALIGAFVALHDWTSSTEKAQKTFNEQLAEGKEEQKKYNDETEKAIELAQKDSDATGERRNALNLLIQRYPSIIKKYIDEKGHLKDILNLKREIAAIDGQKTVEEYRSKSNDYSELAKMARSGSADDKEKSREEYRRLTGKSRWTVGVMSDMNPIADYFENLSKSYANQANREYAKNSIDKFQNTITNWNKSQLEQLSKDLLRGKNTGKNVRLNYSGLQNAILTPSEIETLSNYVDGLISSKNAVVTKSKLEEQKKKLQSQLDSLSTAEVNGAKGKELRNKIKKIEEDLKPYSASYGDKEAKGENKQAKSDEDLIKMQRQRQIEADKQALVTLQAQREAYIASISNDSERELAEMQEAHRKRLEQLEQQKKDYLEQNILQAASEYQKQHENDKNYKGFFTQGLDKKVTLTADQSNMIKAQTDAEMENYKRLLQKKKEADEEYRLQYLEKYGYDYEKRLAIAQQYEKKIANASNEWQRKSLEEEKKSALSAFDLKQVTQMFDWETMLGDVQNYSKKALMFVREQIRTFMETEEFKALQPSEKKIIIDIQRQIDDNLKTNPFKRYSDAIAELKKAERDLQSVKIGQEAAAKNPEASPQMKEFYDKRYAESYQRLKKAQAEAGEAGSKLVDKFNILTGAIGKLGSSTDVSIGELGSAVGDSLEALGLIEDKVPGMIGAIAGGVDILSKVQLTDLIGNIFQNVIKAVYNTVGSIAGVFGLNFGGMDNSAEMLKIQEEQRNWLEIINNSLRDILDELKDSYGIKAIEEYNKLVEQQQKAEEANRKGLFAALTSNYGGGHQDFWHWNKNTLDLAKQIAQTYGIQGVTSWQDLLSQLSTTQFADIRTNHADWWYTMTTQGYNDGAAKEWLNALADGATTAEDAFKALQEQITGTTSDNVFSSFMQNLYDLADGSEDVFDNVSENWQKMVNKMVLDNLLGQKYKSQIEAWYKQWTEAYTGDNTIDSNELESLREAYNQIYRDAADEINAFRESGIIKDADYYSQSATAKSISSITYDQADALEGIATAIQITTERHFAEAQAQTSIMQQTAETANVILPSVQMIDRNISTMLDIQATINDNIAQIANNTSPIAEMAKEIVKIRKQVEKNS